MTKGPEIQVYLTDDDVADADFRFRVGLAPGTVLAKSNPRPDMEFCLWESSGSGLGIDYSLPAASEDSAVTTCGKPIL